MKFENPKMNISMFEMENVMTDASSNLDVAKNTALNTVNTYLGGSAEAASEVLSFKFE